MVQLLRMGGLGYGPVSGACLTKGKFEYIGGGDIGDSDVKSERCSMAQN